MRLQDSHAVDASLSLPDSIRDFVGGFLRWQFGRVEDVGGVEKPWQRGFVAGNVVQAPMFGGRSLGSVFFDAADEFVFLHVQQEVIDRNARIVQSLEDFLRVGFLSSIGGCERCPMGCSDASWWFQPDAEFGEEAVLRTGP